MNKFFDYQYDDLASELTENLVNEITDTINEIQLKSAVELNKYFEKKVNQKCEEIIHDIFSDAELNFNVTGDKDDKISLDVWSDDAELVYTFDLQKALEETVDFWQDADDDNRRKDLAKIFRRFADKLESDE